MKNPTLRIFAVVSLVILLFGGMSVYLALKVRDLKKEKKEMTVQIAELNQVIKNCK